MTQSWTPLSEEPGHPLAALDGRDFAGGTLRVRLGRTSRFGARFFTVHLETGGTVSDEPVLTGLQHSGPLPTYNWIEVASTTDRFGDDGVRDLFALLYDFLPPGGHLMVEYDTAQRAATAHELAHKVPPLATPLGSTLFRVGFGAHFKDWQIAEGGSEGPRKLQAYKPPTPDDASRWRERAVRELEAFLDHPGGETDAADRARGLLAELRDS